MSHHRGFVYGPVPSRRLGRSMGLDIVPHKVCSYDCPYCQIAETTELTLERKAYAPIPQVLAELRKRLAETGRPDWITLAGSGEPTLCLGLGELIAGIHALTDAPVCCITNGSLLWRQDVQDELMGLSRIVPSLDAGSPEVWRLVKRPAPGLDFDTMVDGLVAFRRRFKGEYRLEMFLIDGLNDSREEMCRMAELVRRINPDAVDLNTAVRPTAVKTVRAVPRATLERFAEILGNTAHIIADFGAKSAGTTLPSDAVIVSALARHPSTTDGLATALNADPAQLASALERLRAAGTIRQTVRDSITYFEISA